MIPVSIDLFSKLPLQARFLKTICNLDCGYDNKFFDNQYLIIIFYNIKNYDATVTLNLVHGWQQN
jgi:hypothetical protein